MKTQLLLGVTLTFAACGAPNAGSPDESALVVATVDLSIGVTDGADEYVFGRVGGVTADAAGRIYVAASQSHEIRVYDAVGVFLYSVGRRGAGPGELGRPCCLAFDREGHLWVRDTGNARYNRYRVDGDGGEFIEQRRMAHTAASLWSATTVSANSGHSGSDSARYVLSRGDKVMPSSAAMLSATVARTSR